MDLRGRVVDLVEVVRSVEEHKVVVSVAHEVATQRYPLEDYLDRLIADPTLRLPVIRLAHGWNFAPLKRLVDVSVSTLRGFEQELVEAVVRCAAGPFYPSLGHLCRASSFPLGVPFAASPYGAPSVLYRASLFRAFHAPSSLGLSCFACRDHDCSCIEAIDGA